MWELKDQLVENKFTKAQTLNLNTQIYKNHPSFDKKLKWHNWLFNETCIVDFCELWIQFNYLLWCSKLEWSYLKLKQQLLNTQWWLWILNSKQLTVWDTWKEFLTFSRTHTGFYAWLGLFRLELTTCNSKQQQWQPWTWLKQIIQTPLFVDCLKIFKAYGL